MNKIIFYLFLCFLPGLSFSAQRGDDVAGLPEVGQQFRRTKAGAPVYLECIWGVDIEERGQPVSKRSFDIKSFAGQETDGLSLLKGEKVGSLSVSFRGDHVEHHITINENCRGHGFATWAIQTLESMLNAPSRAHLPCTHFCSTVGDWNVASVALHEKLGFTQVKDEDHQGVPGQPFYKLDLKSKPSP
ncbi:MAG: GNAT family N-acetyltransferase [Holosporaceae bacterium]|nr:MAG: GNAT family N-acetyltransferase [Holosporaceae bacterium]